MRKTRFLLMLCLAASVVCGGHGGGRSGWPRGPRRAEAATPKHYFVARRTTASLGSQIITSTNGAITAYPAGLDTTGAGKACAYVGGIYSRWVFLPDSTGTYDFWETGGDPDSLIDGMDDIALWGDGMVVPDSSVIGRSLILDTDGLFKPNVPFSFDRDDTVKVRYLAKDSAEVNIHVLDEAEFQGGVVIDTSQTLVMRWNHTVSSGSSNVLLDYGDRVTLHADSIDATIANVDTFTTVLSLSDVTADDDVIATDDVRADGGTVTAGDSDTGGSLVVNDGSSNTTTLSGTAWGEDVTISLPILFIDVKLTNPQYITSTKYAYSFYVAGVDSSWSGVVSRSGLYDPGGGSEAEEFPGGTTTGTVSRPYFVYCKADTVRLLSNSCCSYDDALMHAQILLMKKNLFRRGL